MDEQIREQPLMNGSIDVTIGDFAESFGVGLRLQIESKFRIVHSQTPLFFTIFKNFPAKKFYTPIRLLMGRMTIEPIEVVLGKAPKCDQYLWDGKEVVYWFVLEMEEARPF